MKLIPLYTLLISVAVDSKAQKNLQENFSFPPQFPQPNSGIFTPDNSIYLPAESQTPIPYFSIKNYNNLPYQYLPPTGTKAPSVYPTAFPLHSSTLIPNFDDDDDSELNDNNKVKLSSPQFPFSSKLNKTEKSLKAREDKDMKSGFNTVNYQRPTEGIDMKFPTYSSVTKSPSINQTPASRRMIMTAEFQRNEQIPDQLKSTSFQAPQYISSQGVFVSSTTEPAIPILRLSNEIDLDGSFSYEALGADQTHYVQHSRMENMGTEKEEQVVEGSYSYVGDNGQTYTVHYIADSNGFRASGDHLPVPPPVPEIIQRSIQYNLAEEARKPPHLKSWQDEDTERDIGESEKRYTFAYQPQRNLFTGKTPEAFSFNFPQNSNPQNNVATSKIAAKTNSDFTKDQTQSKSSGPISPQITFLASQGAHVPSINSAQQSISRMFTTEKSTLPQIVNYEATIKESDKENNKSLWRWQYGMNTNNDNQMSNKNSVSRSFGESDDIVINFNDMTPDQYTKMIHSQLEPNENTETRHLKNSNNNQEHVNNNINSYNQNNINSIQTGQTFNQNLLIRGNKDLNNDDVFPPSAKYSYTQQNYDNHQQSYKQFNTETYSTATDEPIEDTFINKKIITESDFTPPSQIATQSYDYEESSYEPKRVIILRDYSTTRNTPSSSTYNYATSTVKSNEIEHEVKITTTPEPQTVPYSTPRNIKFTDFIQREETNNNIRSMSKINITNELIKQTTTTEALEEMLKDNIFLKNAVKSKSEEKIINYERNSQEMNQPLFIKTQTEPKYDKNPKFIPMSTKSLNELKGIKRKPMDISELLNFVAMKNHFESNKVKPRNKPVSSYNQKNEFRYYKNNEDMEEIFPEPSTFSYRPILENPQQELRGVIKNYKVLQRTNNIVNNEQDNSYYRKDGSQSMKMLQNPPLGRAGPTMKSYLPPIYV